MPNAARNNALATVDLVEIARTVLGIRPQAVPEAIREPSPITAAVLHFAEGLDSPRAAPSHGVVHSA